MWLSSIFLSIQIIFLQYMSQGFYCWDKILWPKATLEKGISVILLLSGHISLLREVSTGTWQELKQRLWRSTPHSLLNLISYISWNHVPKCVTALSKLATSIFNQHNALLINIIPYKIDMPTSNLTEAFLQPRFFLVTLPCVKVTKSKYHTTENKKK